MKHFIANSLRRSYEAVGCVVFVTFVLGAYVFYWARGETPVFFFAVGQGR